MRAIDTQIEIATDADSVWSIVQNLGEYAQWNPFIVRASGEPAPGQRLSVTARLPSGATATVRPRVVAPTRERELRWRGKVGIPGLFDGEHVLRVEPLGSDRCVFHHSERFTGLLVPLVGGILADTAAGFEAMNRALKARAERAVSAEA